MKVERWGEHLIRLVAPPSSFFSQVTPDCLWSALVEIQKIRTVTCIYHRSRWAKGLMVVID